MPPVIDTYKEPESTTSLRRGRCPPKPADAVASTVYDVSDACSLDVQGRIEEHTTKNAQGSAQDLRCWDHGCNGRIFTTMSNLTRHQREHSERRPTHQCPHCRAVFSRSSARNLHIQKQSCSRIRRYSNGRQRPKFKVK